MSKQDLNAKVYQDVFKNAGEAGNRRMIRVEDFIAVGGDVGDFTRYDHTMTTLESNARLWCNAFFSERTDKTEGVLKKLEDGMFGQIKTIYSYLKTEETENYFYCDSREAHYIASLADKLMAVRNNLKDEEGFSSPRTHSPATHAEFRRKAETHFAAKVLKLDVLTPEQAEYNRQEQKLISKIGGLKRKRKEADERREGFEREKLTSTSASIKTHYDAKIAGVDKELEKLNRQIAATYEELNKFLEEHPDRVAYEKTLIELREERDKARRKGDDAGKRVEAFEKKVDKEIPLSALTKPQMIAELESCGLEGDFESMKKADLKKLVKEERAKAEKAPEVSEQEANADAE